MSSVNLLNYFKELSNSTIVAFVKQQKEMSDRMKNAYQKIKDITSAEIRRMSEEEVLNINNTLLTKVSHIFILDNFSGSSFEHLNSKKFEEMRIFGVPLIERIMDEEEVAITKHWKIYSNTFQNLLICTSNLNSTEKGKIENLVKLMDGQFTNELSSDVTHLITNSTKTVKYSDAVSLDIPIYHTEWINHIWNKWHKNDNVPKADSEQYDVFKLPPLFELKISATGMSRERRNEISDIVEENGGKFEEIFKSNGIDILLMDKLEADNPKFKIANKYKIPVLSTEWINESVKAGYALSYNDFVLKRPKSHDSSSSSFSESITNSSMDETSKLKVEEQKNNEILKSNTNILTDKTNEQFLLDYTLGQAKKLGHMLDGYVFYFYNFPTDHYFKAGKIISACGGIRITELDQSITHILCFDQENILELHKKTTERDVHGSIVEFKWLVECLRQGKLLSETDYLVNLNSTSSKKTVPPSPMSRKAIQSLNVATNNSGTDDSKKENAVKSTSSTSKMLTFSNHHDEDSLIQTSIEANHKKLKQVPNGSVSRKRSYEECLNSLDEVTKRRKTNEYDDSNENSFQVL